MRYFVHLLWPICREVVEKLLRSCREAGEAEREAKNPRVNYGIRNCRNHTPNLSGIAGMRRRRQNLQSRKNFVTSTVKKFSIKPSPFSREISKLALFSTDIELVVRKEDTTSNRRLGSLNFNLSLSLSHLLSLSYSLSLSLTHNAQQRANSLTH